MPSGTSTVDSGLKTFNLRGALTSSSHVPAGVCLARTVLKCVQVQRVPFSEGGSAVHRSNGSKANGSHGRDLMVVRGAISFSGEGGLMTEKLQRRLHSGLQVSK